MIEFDSILALRRFNITPPNRFRLSLDFTEPPGFHKYNPWDEPTPNASVIEVEGNDHTWVTAVHETILSFFRGRRGRKRAWIHARTTFNLLNWLVGIPAALWCTYRLHSAFIARAPVPEALAAAVDIYIFLLSFLVFRLAVYGFRWIFPLIEIHGARSIRIRAAIGVVLSSILLTLLYDVLRSVVF